MLVADADQTTWTLSTNRNASRSVTIAGLLPGGKGLLALPQGAAELQRLPVFILAKNGLGAVRSEAGPGFVEFKVHYGQGASIDDPPGPDDVQVPHVEVPALAQVAAELGLSDKKPEEILGAVTAFFNRR